MVTPEYLGAERGPHRGSTDDVYMGGRGVGEPGRGGLEYLGEGWSTLKRGVEKITTLYTHIYGV